jgi:hypothetical protein
MSRNARIALVVGGVAVIVVALVIVLATSGGSDNKTSDKVDTTIVVSKGQPEGGLKHLTVKKGGQVNLNVKSDITDEVHVHGYDIEKPVKAGGTVNFNFKANQDGVYEVEVHKPAPNQIAELEVQP